MKRTFKNLTDEEHHVLIGKGTERPFTGQYNEVFDQGTYHCKQCNTPLYRSEDKFSSRCGWPSFDDTIPDAIQYETDADGQRTEILCAYCQGHLGHVFTGEQFTEKNTRHCVNSISLSFVSGVATEASMDESNDRKIAYFAGGCFWGMEHLMQKQPGVIDVVSGYTGGHTENPTYREVCAHHGGHVEAIAVTYDSELVDFEILTKFFFEIHDPTQMDGQGPDIGEQYMSVIFYHDEEQKKVAEKSKQILEQSGKHANSIVTEIVPAPLFYKAEEYHQKYFKKHNFS